VRCAHALMGRYDSDGAVDLLIVGGLTTAD